MPNNDYILRSDAVSAFCGNCEATEVCRQLGEPCEEVKQIKAIPAADVEPVRHAYWIDIFVIHRSAQACSNCRTFYSMAYTGGGHPYCPNCGAKMERSDENM